MRRLFSILVSVFCWAAAAAPLLQHDIPGCVARWTMNATNSNATITDISGSNYQGTNVGSASLIGGNVGLALNLNGSGQSFRSGQPVGDFTSQNFTINLWVKPVLLTNSPVILYKGPFGGAGYYSQLNSDGSIFFYCGGVSNSSSAGQLVTNVWQMLTYVREATAVRIYKNGANVTSTSSAIGSVTSSTEGFQIGCYAGGTLFFNGPIDEVSVFNRALSAAEILQFWNNNKSTPQ
jgi:hypothetical protein